ncbi:hypothetical protein AB8A05_06125 [Tardiphaga sp. 538_B7_N1_4]|uniref:hypothetical protein n=1 Tax=Tardiphaga sp. 538_B7_N1_4 TaxID=3240778 RepID=UPI003F2651FC
MITTAQEREASNDQLAIPAMSEEEARCVIKRYEEIVSVRTFVPDGWVNWHLEFRTGQFDDCTFNVDAVCTSQTGNRQVIAIIHRGLPDELREELREVQLEAASASFTIEIFKDFATLPLATLSQHVIDDMNMDIEDPVTKKYIDALRVLKPAHSTNDKLVGSYEILRHSSRIETCQ